MNEHHAIRETVRTGYAAVAERGSLHCGTTGGCCGGATSDSATALAAAVGYATNDLHALPEGANMGLSCGNPTALANLKPGDVVLDLGSGGGFDVFIAGRKVGATGHVIGVDMTPEMLSKARRNTLTYHERTGLNNVEFRLGEIEHLPVADNSVDVIISNCVINLSPDKPQVWREIARVLKPGGRVSVSDIALLHPLPQAILDKVAALVGCVAGAVTVESTQAMAAEAGLTGLQLDLHSDYIDAMTNWEDPLYKEIVALLPEGAQPGDFVTSLSITATKPARTSCCG